MAVKSQCQPFDSEGRYWVGIDPGNTGALAVVDEYGDAMGWTRMPIIKVGRRTEINVARLKEFLPYPIRGEEHKIKIVIEEVTSFGMGRTSAFTFGKNLGVLLGVVSCMGFPMERPRPKQWQKVMLEGLAKGEHTKSSANVMALRLYPQLSDTLKVKANQGIADAILMAEWARRISMKGG